MSAHSPGSAENQQAALLTIQEKREALIAPLTAKLQVLWSKGTLTSDELQLLQLMSTLVRLSDLDVLQTLPIANEIMPPTEAWGSLASRPDAEYPPIIPGSLADSTQIARGLVYRVSTLRLDADKLTYTNAQDTPQTTTSPQNTG